MKKLLSLLFVLLICLSLAGCGKNSSTPLRPKDSSLEFWIADSVKLEDFSGHDEIAGWFGAFEYLGTGYRAVTDEDGMNASRPDIYVTYIITAYPDYSSGTLAVTGIEITDPAVTVYGLTVKSSPEEWDAVLREMGFEIRRSGLAEKDGFRFSYSGGEIRISAEVTNKQGIVF
ncbi:MAG: hypothetical protein II458_05370 [Oscillospiraceae bacterium]|nr:hypothetical protein [Oscillospiraceae bacterium]